MRKGVDSEDIAHCSLTFSLFLSSILCVCVCFLFGVVFLGRKKCHTSLEKSKAKLNLFPRQPNQWSRSFTSSARRTKKHFYARSNHITPCHCPSTRTKHHLPTQYFTKLSFQLTLCSFPPFCSSFLLLSPTSLLSLPTASPPSSLFPPFSLQALASLNAAFSVV